MKGKTKIRIIDDVPIPCRLKKGMEGYIDDYVQTTTTGAPRAVVVSGSIVDIVPLYALEVIENFKSMSEEDAEKYLDLINDLP